MPMQLTPPQYIGNNLSIESEALLTQQTQANAASSAGGQNFVANSATSATLTALGNLSQQFTAGAATTVTFDSAYNIGLTLPQPLTVGQRFGFEITTNAATTIATPTLLASDVSLVGTTSMLASALRKYNGTVTQSYTTSTAPLTSGTTFTSLAQFSANLFTVTLGTNALVPVVGNLLHINVTSGTLPSGWYPIVKVTTATSFIIATPPGTVWAATVATVDSVAPAQPQYAPLISIQGMYTVGANVAV